MATVVAFSADLLFGSQIQGALVAAGHDVQLIGTAESVRERLAGAESGPVDVLIVDLVDERLDGAGVVESLAAEGALDGIATLAFYSHVDAEARAAGERAGIDRVVPRSRMAREAPDLVAAII